MRNAASRVAELLSFEGIPNKQRAKYLETQCGIPEFNAFRLLRGIDPILPTTLKELANGLNVSEGWLEEGRVDLDRLHDLEIYLVCKGYQIADAYRIFRLRQDFVAEDPVAEKCFGLVRPGVFLLTQAARLYDDHLKRSRLKLVWPKRVDEAASPCAA
jgi:hypothetical protein